MKITMTAAVGAAGLALTLMANAKQGKLYMGSEDGTTPRWATAADFDGSILFCRGYYGSDRHEANGSGWFTDYPGADQNFLTRLSELTEVHVRFDQNRIPFYVVVRLDDPALLYKCPVLFMSDVGTARFTSEDVRVLKGYFERGGFLWVDDFWGDAAWDQWIDQIREVLPSGLYPMEDITPDHSIFHQLYDVKGGIWQQSTIGIWNGGVCTEFAGDECLPQQGVTSERGDETRTPHFRGILDERGHTIVVMSHNTDIADGWEEEKPENQEYINEFSAKSYALGINIFLYALTH